MFARQCGGGIDGVVLIDEQGVEESVVAGDPMDLAQRQMLVVEGVVVKILQPIQEVGDSRRGGDIRAHRHGIDQQSDHRFRAGQINRPPRNRGAERDVVLTGERHQQLRPGGLQNCADGGVAQARQLAKRPRGLG